MPLYRRRRPWWAKLLRVKVVVWFGLALIVGWAGTCTYTCTHDRAAAQVEAESWASDINGVKRVVCVGYDSDYDGYVSCTVYRTIADPLYIECAGALTIQSGCRGRKGE